MGAQALRMAVSDEACAWKAREIEAASEALNELGTKALQQMGDAGLAGLVALLGLALRRAAPNAPNVGDAEREAYFHLQRLLMRALLDGNKKGLSADAPASIRAALLKSHTLRSLSVLVAASAGGLLSLGPQRPSRRTLQASLLLLLESRRVLHYFCTSPLGKTAAQRKSRAAALRVELEASGLLESWSRLALAVAACDGGQETAAKDFAELVKTLTALVALESSPSTGGGPMDPWASYLLSGACPSLAFLLTSHVVSFAAELDGGPTHGLPAADPDGCAAGSGSGAGPSSGSVRARPPVPLLDSSGALLRGNRVVIGVTALWAVEQWTRVQVQIGLACRNLQWDPLQPPFSSAKPLQSWPWGPRLLQHLWAHLTPANPGPDPIDRAWAPVHACVRAAMQRRDPLANPVAAFQLGMRLATLAAHAMLSHSNSQQGAGAVAGVGVGGGGVALQAAAARGRLSASEAGLAAYSGLRLAREALGVPRVALEELGDGLPGLTRPQLAWWRAAVAWAGLWQHASWPPGFGVDSTPLFDWDGLSRAALDAEPALSCGYLSVLEALLRHPKAEAGEVELLEEGRAWCDVWGPSLLCAEPREIASLAATLGKLLRRSADRLLARLANSAAAGPGAGGDGEERMEMPGLSPAPDEGVGRLAGSVRSLLWLLLDWLPALLTAAEPWGAGAGAAVHGASQPVPASPHAQAWRELLWRELDPTWMVGAALVLPAGNAGTRDGRCAVLWELVVRAPERLAAAVAAADAAEAAVTEKKAAGEGAATAPGGQDGGPPERWLGGKLPPLGTLSMNLLKTVLGESELPALTSGERPAGPCLLAAIQAVCSGARASAAAPGSALDPSTWGVGAMHLLRAPSLLPPPDAARVLLPRCCNPACVRLEGPSEAGLRLEACAGGCGKASYCCRACQQAHAAAGHARDCRAAAEANAA
ncbi:hypothetical protein HYH03_009214 [Edaphochlamys debaryana]|uniref:MYND-type domain-containing protein n=1 Tax=Edaphochlamys debaryana TaxID=47281 RepID=A0A836BXB0_9CHLO|nr:hypothetical protein HYH03_009214 [Edaphochlamys debaryana]|eukprot:KAG2492551.1 hypothetical protein HYH03_009214 [Edaphochlamys debaryana]